MINITNEQFLYAIFGDSYIYSHVTSFIQDPTNIPNNERGLCWSGGYYKDTNLIPNSNQFYTVSLFTPDENNRSRRKKAQFSGTYVIGLDDVREKLPIEQVMKLPPPSIVLKSSLYSEQWLYILDQPEQNRDKIDNLHDGLIKNGLAPDSKDPGQKGVTRYLRLPEGINTKAKRIEENNSTPPQCEITTWHPERRYTIEQLAEPFRVDLNLARPNKRVDGATHISDHPLLHTGIIEIKSKLSDGRYDITCPWVNGHTDHDDSGSAFFLNEDASIGFRCHHGSCDGRTGRDLLQFIDSELPGFTAGYKNWQILREFSQINEPEEVSFMEPISFMDPIIEPEEVSFMDPISFMDPAPVVTQTVVPVVDVSNAIQSLCDSLRRQHPTSDKARKIASDILKYVDDLQKLDQIQWHTQVCDLMLWNKTDFKDILKDLRHQWYGEKISNAEFYDNVVYVKDLNQFYDYKSRIFFSTMGFQNSYSHEDNDVCKTALQEGMVKKVDKLDYAPKQPRLFIENGIVYGNTWTDVDQPKGVKGDIAKWYEHFDTIGWSENRKHLVQWMAHTLRHPDIKINHMIILGSGEGCGKDYLLYPLSKAMGENYEVVSGEELCSDFNDYFLATKYLHINEAELGTRAEATMLSNKLKPLAAAPPETLRVNQKGIKPIKVRNIINASMTTNSTLPISLSGVASRRFYAVWSDLNPRDRNDNMLPGWLNYWEDKWSWMKSEGWKAVIHHLMYEVDLSDFNPAEPPKVTEFLNEIKNASKPLLQQTVEVFVEKQHGLFKSDLLTSNDMAEVLKSGAIFAPNDMYANCDYITPIKLGMVLKTCNNYKRITTFKLSARVYIWVLRNDLKYNLMTSTELYQEYERQIIAARNNSPMKIVNP